MKDVLLTMMGKLSNLNLWTPLRGFSPRSLSQGISLKKNVKKISKLKKNSFKKNFQKNVKQNLKKLDGYKDITYYKPIDSYIIYDVKGSKCRLWVLTEENKILKLRSIDYSKIKFGNFFTKNPTTKNPLLKHGRKRNPHNRPKIRKLHIIQTFTNFVFPS